jgi:hypothetical protein
MVGSGIRKKPIPDPGSGGQKGTGSRIRIRNTAHLTVSCITGARFLKRLFGSFNSLAFNFYSKGQS